MDEQLMIEGYQVLAKELEEFVTITAEIANEVITEWE